MTRNEIIHQWQLLLDNYGLLELLFQGDKSIMSTLAPDKKLIEETLELLKSEDPE